MQPRVRERGDRATIGHRAAGQQLAAVREGVNLRPEAPVLRRAQIIEDFGSLHVTSYQGFENRLRLLRMLRAIKRQVRSGQHLPHRGGGAVAFG